MAINFQPSRFPPPPGSPWHQATQAQIDAYEIECEAVRVQIHREKYSEGLPPARLLGGSRLPEAATYFALGLVFGLLAASAL